MEKTFICTVKKPCCDLCGKKSEKPVFFRFEDSWHLWFFCTKEHQYASENAAPMATSLSNNLSGAPPSSRAVFVLHGSCRCRPLKGGQKHRCRSNLPPAGRSPNASENSSTKAF